MPYPVHPEPSAIAQQTALLNYKPTQGQVFGAGFHEMIRQTLPGVIATSLPYINELSEFPGVLFKPVMSEAEWKAGPDFRDGLQYPHNGLTPEFAKVLAERKDEESKNAFILSRGSGLVAFAGGLIGSLPDPLNFIPWLGPVAKAASVARMGPVLGRAAVGAVEAGASAIALEPALFAQARAYQEDRDFSATLLNVGAALAIGAGIGTVAGVVKGRPVRERTNAVRKAASDLIQGKPVDVAPALPPKRMIDAAPPAMRERIVTASETPAVARTPEQMDLLSQIDPHATKQGDWSVLPEEKPGIADPIEPTSPKNEGQPYKPVQEAFETIPEQRQPQPRGPEQAPVSALRAADEAQAEVLLGRKLTTEESLELDTGNVMVQHIRKRSRALQDAVGCLFGE